MMYIKYIKTLWSGLFMGIAGMIPGVSSGTVAVITGAYPKLISSLKTITSKNERKRNAITFLCVLFSGMIVATFLSASFMEVLINDYPIFTNLFFIGLIVGTIPILLKKSEFTLTTSNYKPIFPSIAFLLSIAFVILTSSTSKEQTESFLEITLLNFLLLFLAGFISGGVGLVPGVSGSMVLLSLGLYTKLIAAINQFQFFFLLSLAAGAALGFIVFSKVIHILLNQFRQIAYLSIGGLLIGSAIILFPEGIFQQEILFLVLSLALILIGFALSYFIGGEQKHAKSNYI